MVGIVKFDIKGAKEMERILKALGPEIASKVGDQALRAAGKVVADEAKRLVHVRSGALRDSIVVRGERKRKNANERLVQVTFEKPHSRRAHLEEFGTSRQAAHPFLRPAADNKVKEAIGAFGKVMARGVAREAKKMAKPLARL